MCVCVCVEKYKYGEILILQTGLIAHTKANVRFYYSILSWSRKAWMSNVFIPETVYKWYEHVFSPRSEIVLVWKTFNDRDIK